MRSLLLAVSILGMCLYANAQRTEVSIVLQSGLCSFTGTSAADVTFINAGSYHNYTNNPYGSRKGICYGAGINLKHISRSGFVAGGELAYELLRSKVSIDHISLGGASTGDYGATGRTYLNTAFLNLYPYLGYRFQAIKRFKLDLAAGLDIARCLSTQEKGRATTNGGDYTTDVDRKTIDYDIRPRAQVAFAYKRYGAYLGYSFGLANFKSGYVGGTNECYMQVLRFGLSWQIR